MYCCVDDVIVQYDVKYVFYGYNPLYWCKCATVSSTLLQCMTPRIDVYAFILYLSVK